MKKPSQDQSYWYMRALLLNGPMDSLEVLLEEPVPKLVFSPGEAIVCGVNSDGEVCICPTPVSKVTYRHTRGNIYRWKCR